MKRKNPIHNFRKQVKILSKLAIEIKHSKRFKNGCCSNRIAFKSIGCNFTLKKLM